MEITCPKCGQAIPPDAVNVARDVAYCRQCNEAFALSELVGTQEDYFADVDLDVIPRGVTVEDYGHRCVIRASTRRLGWAFFWSLFAIGFGVIAPIGITSAAFAGEDSDPHTALIALPFLAVGVFAWYMMLLSIIGRVEVTIDGGTVTVFTGFGSIGRTKTTDWTTVKEVYLTDSGVRENNRPIPCLILDGERPVKFGTNLPEDRKAYVGAVLEELLKRRR